MYFILKNDISFESEFNINEPTDDFPIELDFLSGSVITLPIDTPFVFTTNAKSGNELRDFLDCSFPLMSKRFLRFFEESGVDNLQVFPAVIKSTEDGTIWEDYFVINVLGMIACADINNSTYDEIMPGHYIFDELAINADKAKGALLFRLHEHSPTIIMHKSVGKYIMSKDPDKTTKGWTVGTIIQ